MNFSNLISLITESKKTSSKSAKKSYRDLSKLLVSDFDDKILISSRNRKLEPYIGEILEYKKTGGKLPNDFVPDFDKMGWPSSFTNSSWRNVASASKWKKLPAPTVLRSVLHKFLPANLIIFTTGKSNRIKTPFVEFLNNGFSGLNKGDLGVFTSGFYETLLEYVGINLADEYEKKMDKKGGMFKRTNINILQDMLKENLPKNQMANKNADFFKDISSEIVLVSSPARDTNMSIINNTELTFTNIPFSDFLAWKFCTIFLDKFRLDGERLAEFENDEERYKIIFKKRVLGIHTNDPSDPYAGVSIKKADEDEDEDKVMGDYIGKRKFEELR